MDGNYEHTLTLIDVSSGSGTIDSTTGRWTGTEAPSTYYDGKVDAQEMSAKGLSLAAKTDGVRDLSNVLEVFLKDESNIASIPLDAVGTLVRGDETNKVTVIAKRKLDGVLIVEAEP